MTPSSVMPSLRAAEREKSAMRSRTAGPRSLTRTSTVVLQIGEAHPRAERQCTVRHRERGGVEALAARRRLAGKVGAVERHPAPPDTNGGGPTPRAKQSPGRPVAS